MGRGCVQISELGHQHPTINWDFAKEAYDRFTGSLKETSPEDIYPEFKSIIQPDTESVAFDKITAYTERLGCTLAE
jgi:hypothetical protein